MIEKKINSLGGYGLFASQIFLPGTLLFTEKDWYADIALGGWEVHSIEEVNRFPESEKEMFLKYSFDLSFGKTMGTFSENHVHNLTNFLNHSCGPNTQFDGQDNIIAKGTIYPGDELTIDYGSFVVNFDQSFQCFCGTSHCRSRIKKEDWKVLSLNPENKFPKFLSEAILLSNQIPV
ncbi:SET domain-containing protein [Leptospira idonii]|nr:SET domain-containing protein [Leptospira idonii]